MYQNSRYFIVQNFKIGLSAGGRWEVHPAASGTAVKSSGIIRDKKTEQEEAKHARAERGTNKQQE